MLPKLAKALIIAIRDINDLKVDVKRIEESRQAVADGKSGVILDPIVIAEAAARLIPEPKPGRDAIPPTIRDVADVVLAQMEKPKDGLSPDPKVIATAAAKLIRVPKDGLSPDPKFIAEAAAKLIPEPKPGRDAIPPTIKEVADVVLAQMEKPKDGLSPDPKVIATAAAKLIRVPKNKVSVTDVELNNNELFVFRNGIKSSAGKVRIPKAPFSPGGGGVSKISYPPEFMQSNWEETNNLKAEYIQNKPNLGSSAFKNVGTGPTEVVLGASLSYKAPKNNPVFTGTVSLHDDVKLLLGNDGDLEIYHDGTHSVIRDSGTGLLLVYANSAIIFEDHLGGGNMARMNVGGSVELYYDSNKKLETSSTGINVNGRVNGRNIEDDGTKLDGISAGATINQTGSEIKTAYESENNTNVYDDISKAKVDGITVGVAAGNIAPVISSVTGQVAQFTGQGIISLTNTQLSALVFSQESYLNSSPVYFKGTASDPNTDNYIKYDSVIDGLKIKSAAKVELESQIHVTGTAAQTLFNFGYLNPTGNTGFSPTTYTNPFSAIFDGFVQAPEFQAVSDERVKNVISVSNGEKDHSLIQKIQIVDYICLYTGKSYKKVVGQQIAKIYSQAVTLSDGYVPNIRKEADSVRSEKLGDFYLSTIGLKDHKLKITDSVELISKPDFSKIKSKVISVTNDTFTIETVQKLSSVFLVGKRVSDFHSVDYNALSMLTLSALQEEVKKRISLEERVMKLEELLS